MPDYFCKTDFLVHSLSAGSWRFSGCCSSVSIWKEIQELCRAQDQLAEILLSAGVRQKARSSQHSSTWHAEQNRAANLNPADLQDSQIQCSLLRMAYCILAATEIRTIFLQLWNCQWVVHGLKPSTLHKSVSCILISNCIIFIKQFLLFSHSANFLGISSSVLILLFLLTFTISALSHLWGGGAG